MDIVLIAPDNLRAVWPEIRKGLDAMPPDDWIAEDVYHAIKASEAALYVGVDDSGIAGFMVLQQLQTQYTKRPYLHVWLTYNATPADVFTEGEAVIRDCARNMGASHITFGSPRKGWAKRYPLLTSTYEIPL